MPTAPDIVKAQSQYTGIAGYRRMFGELRDSFYHDIPEARGRIDMVDATADREAEITRLSQSLNADPAAIRNKLAAGEGHALGLKNRLGQDIGLAFGWPVQAGEDLSFSDISVLARVLIHETGHLLDKTKTPLLPGAARQWEANGVHPENVTRRRENFADLYAQNLLLKNGEPHKETRDLINEYDFTTAITTPGRHDHSSYDSGDRMLLLLAKHPDGPGLTSFKLQGWRTGIAEVEQLFQERPIDPAETILNRAIAETAGYKVKQLMKDPSYAGKSMDATDSALCDWATGQVDVADRLRRMAAACNYMAGKTDKLRDYDARPDTIDQVIVKAWEKERSLLDGPRINMSQLLFLNLTESADLNISPRGLHEALQQHPAEAKAIAAGTMSLEELIKRDAEKPSPPLPAGSSPKLGS